MLYCTAAILWTINLHWSYLFLSYWDMWYGVNGQTVGCVLPLDKSQCRHRTRLVSIILLVIIIPDNWRCFSIFGIKSCLLLIFQCCYQRLTPCAGCGLLRHTDLELMWLVDRCACRVFMHSVCHLPLKLDEFICLLHRRPCDVTIAHTSIKTTMLKRYVVQLYWCAAISFWFSWFLLKYKLALTTALYMDCNLLSQKSRHHPSFVSTSGDIVTCVIFFYTKLCFISLFGNGVAPISK